MALETITNFPSFECGSKFSSYSEFEAARQLYENQNFVVLIKTKSEKFPDGHKHRETLLYKNVNFECKKGRNRKGSVSKGIRPNVKSGKLGCHFKLRLSVCKGFLVVKESRLEHSNHELSEERFRHLPEKLRLNEDEMKYVEHAMKLGSSMKEIQADLMQQRGGKPVLLKSLQNISAKIRRMWANSGQTTLERMLDSMKSIPDAIVNGTYEEETKELVGIFFQDTSMQATFEKFPELIIFDATYELNDHKLPLFISLVVDGNGESEIVALFIVRPKSKMCVGARMLDFLKENNEAWKKVEVVVGDRDFADRVVFAEKFPSAKIQICLLHALHAFEREMQLNLGSLDATLKRQVLEIFTDLVYSESEEAYDLHYSKLVSLDVQDLIVYYDSDWHCTKHEWVLYEQNNFILKNKTANSLESLNRKMKAIITRCGILGKFFQDLIISASSTNAERQHRALTMTEKVPVVNNNFDEVEREIRKGLTQFAASYVCAEYEESKKLTLLFQNIEDDFYMFENSLTIFKTTESSCSCKFRSSVGLPCRHIMAVRRDKNLAIYDSSLCVQSWIRPTRLSASTVIEDPQGWFPTASTEKSECQKYSEASEITMGINSILSKLSDEKYEYYMEKLRDFQNLLASDKLIDVSACSDSM